MKRRILACIAAAFVLAGCSTAATHTAKPSATSQNAGCSGGDGGPYLQAVFNAVPAGTSLTLPPNLCINVDEVLWIHNTTNLTLNFNGDRFDVPATSTSNEHPVLTLTQDTNLTIENLNVYGGGNGSNGGPGYENDYGVEFQADSGVTLTHDNMTEIQGDFLYLSPPYSVKTGDTTALSTGIVITNDQFYDAGYHGLTIESVNGLTVSHDIFDGMGTDAIDAEYDDYSSGINPNGTAYFAAQDNISITDNTWENFGSDWFSSLQGQVPGVQQQNVTLAGNTIDSGGPLVEINGTNPGATTAPYINRGLVIAYNTETEGAVPTRGGSITTPFAGSAMTITYASNVTMAFNSLYMYDGTCDPPASYAYYCGHPYIAVLQANVVSGLAVEANAFDGALGVLHPSSANNSNVTECGNDYGVGGTWSDTNC